MKRLTSALDKRVKEGRLPSIVGYAEQKSDHYFVKKKKNFTKSRKNRTVNIRRMTKKDSGRQRSLRRDRCSEAKEDKNRQPGNKLTLKK